MTRRPGSPAPAEAIDPAEPAPRADGWLVETVVSPFHCLYQDALAIHSQSRQILKRSEGDSSRLARAALLLYVTSAEAIVHQAAVELGRPEFAAILADPARPMPLADVWRLLPAVVGGGSGPMADPGQAPWPQFAELLSLRDAWSHPGPPTARRAYYQSPSRSAGYEPLTPRQIPPTLAISAADLHHPLTGLPRDPYALRPDHLDTVRAILDAAIAALDRRLGGALTRDNRHRREPTRVV